MTEKREQSTTTNNNAVCQNSVRLEPRERANAHVRCLPSAGQAGHGQPEQSLYSEKLHLPSLYHYLILLYVWLFQMSKEVLLI